MSIETINSTTADVLTDAEVDRRFNQISRGIGRTLIASEQDLLFAGQKDLERERPWLKIPFAQITREMYSSSEIICSDSSTSRPY